MTVLEYVVFHPWKTATVLLGGVLIGFAAFYAYQVNVALDVLATEAFDPEDARAALGASAPDTDVTFVEPEVFEPGFELGVGPLDLIEEQEELAARIDLNRPFDPRELSPYSFGVPIPDSVFESYLLIGTDASGSLADAIILGLQPTEGGAPIMVSLPRDLYVWNICKRTFTRLNVGLGGCRGMASGSEMMAILVEDYTGIPIDHLARIDFTGFTRVIDSMGGITICVNNPTRDLKSKLDLPQPGCQTADGATALAWVRSRHTEQLIGDEWVRVAGSDFARQSRQQDVLFQLARRAARFSSPGSLSSTLSAAASSVKLDSTWTFGEAVGVAWRYRGISRDSVRRFTIAVDNYRTPGGAAVLLPARAFHEQLSDVYDLG